MSYLEMDHQFKETSLQFGVFLMNLTTNTRIWNALHNEAANSTLIKSVLQENTLVRDNNNLFLFYILKTVDHKICNICTFSLRSIIT